MDTFGFLVAMILYSKSKIGGIPAHIILGHGAVRGATRPASTAGHGRAQPVPRRGPHRANLDHKTSISAVSGSR